MQLTSINFGIISRQASASTATGYNKVHVQEQAEIVETALVFSDVVISSKLLERNLCAYYSFSPLELKSDSSVIVIVLFETLILPVELLDPVNCKSPRLFPTPESATETMPDSGSVIGSCAPS
jgi:hypothetical protein